MDPRLREVTEHSNFHAARFIHISGTCMFRRTTNALLATTIVLGAGSLPARADEGMWTTFNFPKAAVKQKYGVDISDSWLERVQRATTRLEGGCTGSFVSKDGLVLTNHHCVVECLSDLSSKGFGHGPGC